MSLFNFLDQCEEKRQKKKKAYYLFFFFGINWYYFTMSLLYYGLILEALSFYGKKKIWALFKKNQALS